MFLQRKGEIPVEMNKDKLWGMHTYIGQTCGQLEALIFECQDNQIPAANAIEAQRNLRCLKILIEDEMKRMNFVKFPKKE